MERNTVIGKTEIRVLIGFAIAVATIFIRWGLNLIPGGGIIGISLAVISVICVGIGRWLPQAPNWMKSYSNFIVRHLKVSVVVIFILLVSGIISTAVWRVQVASDKAQKIAAQEAMENKKKEAKKKEEEDKREAAKRIEEKKRKAEKDNQLIANAALTAERLKGELDSLDVLVKKGKCDESKMNQAAIVRIIEDYRGLDSVPSEIGPVLSRYDDIIENTKMCQRILAAIHDLDVYKDQARAMSERTNDYDSDGWQVVIERYSQALNQVVILENVDSNLRHLIPKSLNLKKQRRKIDFEIKQAEKKKNRAEEEDAKIAAYKELCGEKPEISSWDGEIIGLEAVIRRNAHDPSSIDVEKCSNPVLTLNNCWVSTCNVRGKNAFGALILNRVTYSFSTLGTFEVE